MKKYDKETLEEILIRSGDLLNSLGILRSAKINNYVLKKEKFIELIKRKYILTDLPLNMLNKIDSVWNESIELFKRMNINNNSTLNEIKVNKINLFSKNTNIYK